MRKALRNFSAAAGILVSLGIAAYSTATPAAAKSGVFLGLNFGPPVVYAPPYYAPPPAYAPPTYYAPAPYYAPPPVYYVPRCHRHYDWRWNHYYGWQRVYLGCW